MIYVSRRIMLFLTNKMFLQNIISVQMSLLLPLPTVSFMLNNICKDFQSTRTHLKMTAEWLYPRPNIIDREKTCQKLNHQGETQVTKVQRTLLLSMCFGF